ncbi:hypothetical protein WICPIJ_004916 [Wickerhamomyces pijperi]|uniref:DNA-binding protein RAP1 n=1 Tax=Wickerhamomyces pijperi TaxID=599730 RepID=A0A9P8Q6Q4_WICPI|nr:hypothetical protein WICPIJ_004916 [Wickerhamomyces pijperi]
MSEEQQQPIKESISDFVDQPKDDNSNIDSALLEKEPVYLFTDAEGQPILFYIADTESDKTELSSLVVEYGGAVSSNPREGLYISTYHDAERETYSSEFIRKSVQERTYLNKEKFKIAPQYDNQADSTTASNKNNNLQPLVDYMEDRTENFGPYAAAAAAAAAVAANSDQQLAPVEVPVAGPAHPQETTVQSEKTTTAVESVPATTHQSFPSVTRRSNSTSAAASKNGFTDEEDEIILEYVRNNPTRRSTHKLFQEIAEKLNKHTGNSVRYRYRCVLLPKLEYVYVFDDEGNLVKDENGQPKRTHDLPTTLKKKFTAEDDYIICSAVRATLNEKMTDEQKQNGETLPLDPHDALLPGKFFDVIAEEHRHHSRAAWRDRYRKFIIPYGIDKFIAYYEDCKAKGEEPVEIKNFTGNNLFKTTKKFLKGEYDPESMEDQLRPTKRQRKSAKNQADKHGDMFMNAESYPGYNTQNTTETAVANALNAAQKHQYYPHLTLEQASFLTPELVSEKFLQFNPILSVVDKVNEIVSRDFTATDADELVETFRKEVGIEPKFSGLIITQVCGELLFIPTYIERFLKTGENPPNNIRGIWTAEHDDMLKRAKPEDLEFLKSLHGEHRLETRRSILNDHHGDGDM